MITVSDISRRHTPLNCTYFSHDGSGLLVHLFNLCNLPTTYIRISNRLQPFFFNNNAGLQRYNVMVIFLRPNDDSHSTCTLTNRTFNVQRSSTFIRKHYFISRLIFATHIRNVVLHCYLVIFLNFLSRQASSNLLNLRPSSEVKIC